MVSRIKSVLSLAGIPALPLIGVQSYFLVLLFEKPLELQTIGSTGYSWPIISYLHAFAHALASCCLETFYPLFLLIQFLPILHDPAQISAKMLWEADNWKKKVLCEALSTHSFSSSSEPLGVSI